MDLSDWLILSPSERDPDSQSRKQSVTMDSERGAKLSKRENKGKSKGKGKLKVKGREKEETPTRTYTRVTLQCIARVRMGESVHVLGDAALGSFSLEQSIRLVTTPETYPLWTTQKPLMLRFVYTTIVESVLTYPTPKLLFLLMNQFTSLKN